MSNLSNKDRKLICDNLESGRTTMPGLATTFGVSVSSVRRIWIRYHHCNSFYLIIYGSTLYRYCDTGSTDALPKGGNRNKVLDQEMCDYIQELIDEKSCITLVEIQELLRAICEVTVSLATIQRAIKDFNYSFKRMVFRPLAGDTEVLWLARQTFSTWMLRQYHERKILFFIDETGFKVEMRSQYGRAKKGMNAEAIIPHIRSRNISVAAAMSSAGIIHYEVLNGNGNAERFTHFIDDLGHHRDQGGYNNDDVILVMDNVRFHSSAIVREMIELRCFEVKFQ